jgi:hypothetical protein
VSEGTGFTSSGRLLETRGILMTSGTRSLGRNGMKDVMQEGKKRKTSSNIKVRGGVGDELCLVGSNL